MKTNMSSKISNTLWKGKISLYLYWCQGHAIFWAKIVDYSIDVFNLALLMTINFQMNFICQT